ncbi:DNA-binding NarL/FixJ family response regulator [Saccharothrix tamanrassetensis]|uniref:DNA-binding NarL/FixJ family response regulator n=1 Tax=Saccharothrix tamanrassetensis TaxID=1051531 RepID=A0A841CMK6_9PSEU|nr:response regulator transcription factor [Saccharothrix tamanrassetensis]MBB5959702.1 DNA-binding NarL/FixJ family response regulator [Saccharothrix tamanrassetensis]
MQLVLIMDDEVRRYGVAAMLAHVAGVDAVVCHGTAEEAVRAGVAIPDLMVMCATDLPSPGGPAVLDTPLLLLVDGTEGVGALGEVHPCVQALVDWSGLTPNVLADAVADVMAGKFYLSPVLARRVLGRQSTAGTPQWGPMGSGLTPRELEVLRLVAGGLSNKQVARQLQISEHGVKRLMGNVLAKLNSPNRTLAVVRAIEYGLLADPKSPTGSATSVA